MHTVIAAECTGCELCLPACPVDCIDLISPTLESTSYHADPRYRDRARDRYLNRNQRLSLEKSASLAKIQKNSIEKRRSYVQEALARVKAKKSLG